MTVLRDNYGVPHIYGKTLRPLFYGVGYAQAEDRLWQADLHRRLATGTLSEFFGPEYIEGDILARTTFGPIERRVALLDTVKPETRAMLQAFTDGMNAWIDNAAAAGSLPPEYHTFGLTVRAWSVDDSVAVAMMLGSQFGWFGSEEVDNLQHLQELMVIHGPDEGAVVFADTHWLDDPDAPTSVPNQETEDYAPPHPRSHHEQTPAVTDAAARFRASRKGWIRNCLKAGMGKAPSSNAIVLSPKLTTDRHALLLGGPQMGYSTPQLNHEVGIHGAGYDVTGTQIAGWPGVTLGVGRNYSWTLTSGVTDNSDIYVEAVKDGQYLFNEEWRDLDCRIETIEVRGGAIHEVEVCQTIHGPVIAMLPEQAQALTLKVATQGSELRSFEAWTNLGRASSLHEFNALLSRIAYNFNVLYADARGNIAYWHIGKIPVRADGDNPWLPHDGTGGAEWEGFIPWEEMPHIVNPKQGWLASWNNKPASGWQNSVAEFGTMGPVHRVNTLVNLLEDLRPRSASLSTLEEINRTAGWTTDTPSGSPRTVFVSTLLADLIAQVDAADDPRIPGILDMLESWEDWLQVDTDQDGRYDDPSVAVFNTWWQKLVDQVFTDDLGSTLNGNVVSNLLARILDDAPAVPVLHDYLDGVPVGEAVTDALIQGLDALTVEYGSADVTEWLQPVALINWSPLAGVPGVSDTTWMNRGTYNQLVHLGNRGRLYGINVVSPGQSGDPTTPHFADQLELYSTWKYKPMILDKRDLKGRIESKIRLEVPR